MKVKEIRLGVVKRPQHAVRESGDTVEVVERPMGGISVILVDGQGTGRSAKRISQQVVNKAASLIGDGARDGVVVRAAHDMLYASREGRVSATMSLVSVDLHSQTMIISRITNAPVILKTKAGISLLNSDKEPLGRRHLDRPHVNEFPLDEVRSVVCVSDGIVQAGKMGPDKFDLDVALGFLQGEIEDRPQEVAETFLRYGIRLDQGRPRDDMTVCVVTLCDEEDPPGVAKDQLRIRRLNLRFPVE